MPNGTEETNTGIGQIDIDQLEGSFSKGVRYSMEVWVAADKEKIFHNLNTRERDILDSKAWLNGIIIDGHRKCCEIIERKNHLGLEITPNTLTKTSDQSWLCFASGQLQEGAHMIL